jgi:hypothetical protein
MDSILLLSRPRHIGRTEHPEGADPLVGGTDPLPAAGRRGIPPLTCAR